MTSEANAAVDLNKLVHNLHDIGYSDLEKVGLRGQPDEGQVCNVISRDLSGSDDLNVSFGRILPGQHHLCHHHPDASEFYVIIAGSAIIHLGDQEHRAKPGDAIYIPRGTTHGITNDTDEPLEMVVGMSKPADWEFVHDE